MFRHVSQLVVRIADLAEAEGRELRKVLHKLGLSFSVMFLGAALALVGGALIIAAVWLGLREPLGPAWASAVTGLLALGMAGGAIYTSIQLNK